MKKKLSSLIGLLALVVGLAYAAGETEMFTISFHTKPATESTSGYFTLGEKAELERQVHRYLQRC